MLDQALRAVPMLATLGIRPDEATTGIVVLRLPYRPAVTNAAGAVHTAAIFAVGELAAAVVIGTHPSLGHLVHLQKSTRIKYRAAARTDVTAHAAVTALQVAAIEQGADALEVAVAVLDAEGHAVAELVSRFAIRR